MRRWPLDRWKFNRPAQDVVDLVWQALELADVTPLALKPPGLTEDPTGQREWWSIGKEERPSRIRVSFKQPQAAPTQPQEPGSVEQRRWWDGRLTRPNRIQLWYARLRWGDPIDLLEADVRGAKSKGVTYVTWTVLDWKREAVRTLDQIAAILGPLIAGRSAIEVPEADETPPTRRRRPESPTPRGGSLSALAVVVGLTLPPLAVLFTVLTVLVLGVGTNAPKPFGVASNYFAVALGLVAAAVVSALILVMLWRYSTAQGINGRQAGQLSARLQSLEANLETKRDGQGPQERTGWATADRYARALRDQLARRSMLWVTSAGYLNAWTEVHRGEEASILFLDHETVLGWASDDALRLSGSDIPTAEKLADRLRLAVVAIDKTAEAYLDSTTSTVKPPSPPADELTARAVLMDVRLAINLYRNRLWEGFVLGRNRLLQRAAAGWALVYVAAVIAVLAGAQPGSIIGASLFFLAGAVAGSIGELTRQPRVQTAVEDYGLGRARIWANILISGVSAVIGVALVAVLGVSILGNTLVPAAAGGQPPPILPSSWTAIFDWHRNLLGFVAAVAFGFAPSRLFDLLRSEQTTAVQALQNSQSTGSS